MIRLDACRDAAFAGEFPVRCPRKRFRRHRRTKRLKFQLPWLCRKCAMAWKIPYPCASGRTRASAVVVGKLGSFARGPEAGGSCRPTSAPGAHLPRSGPAPNRHCSMRTVRTGMIFAGANLRIGLRARSNPGDLWGIPSRPGFRRRPGGRGLARKPVARVRREHDAIDFGSPDTVNTSSAPAVGRSRSRREPFADPFPSATLPPDRPTGSGTRLYPQRMGIGVGSGMEPVLLAVLTGQLAVPQLLPPATRARVSSESSLFGFGGNTT